MLVSSAAMKELSVVTERIVQRGREGGGEVPSGLLFWALFSAEVAAFDDEEEDPGGREATSDFAESSSSIFRCCYLLLASF